MAASVARAQVIGPEFQVNSYTLGNQDFQALAADAAGNFVVVWNSAYASPGPDKSRHSIQGRRYDRNGNALGADFQVNTYTTGDQRYPAVASDAVGNFVVVWNDDGNFASASSVRAQRYDNAGAPLGPEFQVNSIPMVHPSAPRPAVAMDPAGNFVVVWGSDDAVASDQFGRLVARRYDSAGLPVGSQFQVNTFTPGDQIRPAVAMDAVGNFVVVWDSLSDLDENWSVQGQRYDAGGLPSGGQFQVNTYTTGDQIRAAVAMDAVGNFVVVWDSEGSAGSDTSDRSIQGQRFDAGGLPLGSQFQVNSSTTATQQYPSVAVDAAGNFVVAWDQSPAPGAQRYDALGVASGGEFLLTTPANAPQAVVAVVYAAGNLVATWSSHSSSGSDDFGTSIQAARELPARLLGKKLFVRDPSGSEQRRSVIVLGTEPGVDLVPAVLGDPTSAGARLRVLATGTTDSDETYVLDASGWSALGTDGYRYDGPTGGDGDPVKKVILKRTAAGTAVLKAIIKGSVGTQSMNVVPPNLGDDGGIILQILGGGTYCIALGGATGSREVKDDATQWTVINASLHGCPTP